MRFLILGGTAWLGGHVAMTAMRRGHHVTCLARGESGPAPDGAEFARGDRTEPGAYDNVARDRWDVIVDLSRQPGQVKSAVAALKDRGTTFIFISSGNVYADAGTPGQDERAELLSPIETDVMESMESYGAAKVACERHVIDGFGPERSLIARAGLIGGPGDEFGRTGYWPLRFAHPSADDGTVLAPDVPGLIAQVIDVRDLAEWIVRAGEEGLHGIFNATGESLLLSEHLEVARIVADHSGRVVLASPQWLLDRDVEPWAGERSLPLWLPVPDYAGFNSRDSRAARAAGLVTRPLAETLADTLAWELSRTGDGPRRAGLSDADEVALLNEIALNADSASSARTGPTSPE